MEISLQDLPEQKEIEMKIEKLTKEQEYKVKEYRDRYFALATNCEPANRERAEKAALRMSEIVDIKINTIHWVNNPMDAKPLSDSFWDSLRDSLWASLSESFWKSLRSSLRISFNESLIKSLRDLFWNSLWNSLIESLRISFSESLRNLLMKSLRASLSESFRISLSESLRDSLWDSGWLASYSFCAEELKIKIDESTREKLRLHNEIAESCFALWIAPGAIILCERPKSVEIIDGKLIGIEWR
jgi:hypothetical protein